MVGSYLRRTPGNAIKLGVRGFVRICIRRTPGVRHHQIIYIYKSAFANYVKFKTGRLASFKMKAILYYGELKNMIHRKANGICSQ